MVLNTKRKSSVNISDSFESFRKETILHGFKYNQKLISDSFESFRKKTITRSCHQSETQWDAQRLDSVKIQGCSVGISHHFMVVYPWIFHGNQRGKLNRTYKGALTSTRWCSPSYVCWFIIPLTIDISPAKTIVFGVICTNLAIEQGHHLVGKYFLI